MRLDNGIDPATRGAITNVGLLFVTCLYFGAQFFEFPRRRLFVSAFFRAGENRKNGIAGLGCTHHSVACIWRSEERRVGKECRSWWWTSYGRRKIERQWSR